MQVDWSGKEAATRFRVVARSDRASFLELDLITGRTHQIRVHLAAVGHPVIGDATYGKRASDSSTRRRAQHLARKLPDDFLHAAGELAISESVLARYARTGWTANPK